jgi:hypothetical protein
MGSPEDFWNVAKKHIPHSPPFHSEPADHRITHESNNPFSPDYELRAGVQEDPERNPFAHIENKETTTLPSADIREITPIEILELENANPLEQEEVRAITGVIRQTGIDAIALYKSVRFQHTHPFRGKWGIFYTERGIIYIRGLLNASLATAGTLPHSETTTRWAYQFLQAHERYHYCFDMYAMSAEASSKQAFYEPLKNAYKHCKHRQVEEAIANNTAWRWALRSANRISRMGHPAEADIIRQFAKSLMKSQPGAYSHFDKDRDHLEAVLATNLVDKDYSGRPLRPDLGPWTSRLPRRLDPASSCPEYLVRRTTPTSVSSPFTLPKVTGIQESEEVKHSLNGKHGGLKDAWEETKRKLVQEPCLPGLRFKPWDEPSKTWSVRVTRQVRAHLTQVDAEKGIWKVVDIGFHKQMGHG